MNVESSADRQSSGRQIRIALVAGEVSGDLLGAGLMRSLKTRYPDIVFEGIGGPNMVDQGMNSYFGMDELTVLGISEVLGKVGRILSIRRKLAKRFIENPPDVFVGIDAPDFNLSLEEKLRRRGIVCIHYVSPTVWAWRRYRLKKIFKAVDHMLALLPFEEKFYRDRNIPVTCVGHPMAEQIPMHPDSQQARKDLGLPLDKVIIALLPGSRKSELDRHGDLFVEAAKWIHARNSKWHFVVAPVNEATRMQFEQSLTRCHGRDLPLDKITGKAREVMTASDLVILASGTAALEAALLKKPMVVTYIVSFFTYVIVKMMTYVKYFSMPNNLAGRELVPELMQYQATPKNIGRAVEKILSNPRDKAKLVETLEKMHQDLKLNGDDRAAEVVLSYIKTGQP